MMRVYVASSWRNDRHGILVEYLRDRGFAVYDFKNPVPGEHGFAWSDIDPGWQQWTPEQCRRALDHPIARYGFARDMTALRAADAVVLGLPCGRSAHLELGWAAGAGKYTVVLLTPAEPELMYGMADAICTSMVEVVGALERFRDGYRTTQAGRR